jgi:predicted HicB family RNase H-like nuclease
MKLKIKNSETITIRIPGNFYSYLQQRALAKDKNMNDYIKNALYKYTGYKGDVNGR